jgi:hypothetical protein
MCVGVVGKESSQRTRKSETSKKEKSNSKKYYAGFNSCLT